MPRSWEKKKKPKSQEQTQSDPFHFVEEEQEPSHTVVEESPDKSLSNEIEDLFSELLGLQHKEDQQVQEEPEENAKSVKERIKTNPKDMVLFAEILKPKFKEFEN